MKLDLQEIRRHLMIKRPQFIPDNEEKLADAEESRGSHKAHHHSPKGHTGRHHKKHDKIAYTTDRVPSTTTESVTKIDTTLSNEKVSVEERLEGYSTTPSETLIAETTTETTSATATPTNLKPRKPPRRQKIKDSSTNRTDIEEDKPQRRRKAHHHRRNNTLLTNSVHDNTLRVTHTNLSDTSEATPSTQDFTIGDHVARKFTTVPTIASTEQSQSVTQQEVADVFRTRDDFEDHVTDSIAITESGTTVMVSTHTTEMPRTDSVNSKAASPDRSRSTPIAAPTTTPSIRRFSKVHKNRTGILKPARIDVTILEAPDRKHKQGTRELKVYNFDLIKR